MSWRFSDARQCDVNWRFYEAGNVPFHDFRRIPVLKPTASALSSPIRPSLRWIMVPHFAATEVCVVFVCVDVAASTKCLSVKVFEAHLRTAYFLPSPFLLDEAPSKRTDVTHSNHAHAGSSDTHARTFKHIHSLFVFLSF